MAKRKPRVELKSEETKQEEVKVQEEKVEEVKEETGKEVKPVEEKAKEPVKEEPKKEEKQVRLTLKKLTADLKDLDLDKTIEYGKKYQELKDIAETFERYKKYFRHDDPDNGARLNYSIYNIINSVLNDEDYGRFQLRYRYLMNILCKGKNGIFSPVNLHKFDSKWAWGRDALLKHGKLVTLIAVSCERGPKNIETVISPDKLLSGLKEPAVSNLKRFHF